MDSKPRRPPHFKVFCSAKNHNKLGQVYQDNALLALYVRLGIEAIERYADRNGDTFIVGDRELVALSGIGRADKARKSLERLAELSPISAERDGDIWRIGWPNLSLKQFNRSAPSTSTPTSPSPPASKRKARRPLVPMPDPISPDMMAKLYTWGELSDSRGRARGITRKQIDYAIESIRDKANARDYQNRDWLRAIQGYIRSGWPLQGFEDGPGGPIQPRLLTYADRTSEATKEAAREVLRESGGRRG